MTEIAPVITFDQERNEIEANSIVYELIPLDDTEHGRSIREYVINAVKAINDHTSKNFGDFTTPCAYIRYEPYPDIEDPPPGGFTGLLYFHTDNWERRTHTIIKLPVRNYRVEPAIPVEPAVIA